jgi:hypothetical protein
MSDSDGSASGPVWRYRFTKPGGEEIETTRLPDDDTAITRARDRSASNVTPVVIHRQDETGIDWEYVTEVDSRP